tara:strand:- start:90 stop:1061 length:972 start_codon:yes stop_codon:yes gene_type:complete
MEYDFSREAKEFLDSQAAKRSGPKSGAQTPAKPNERKEGSSENKKGSAGKDGKKITFSENIVTSLKNKVKEHNEKYSKKVSLTQLKKIYRRGAGAFSSSHRPGKTRGQWAMARVNMFLKMVRGGEVKKAYRAADQDVAEGSEEYYLEEEGQAFVYFDELDFALARLDFVKVDASDQSDQEVEDLEYTEAEKKTLNKPFRLKDGKKKFGVYVKNPKTGNVIMVKFGDPNMEIKRDDPARRRNFRARHKCDTAKDKTTPRYWSCKFWSKKPVSSMASEEVIAWDENEKFSQWCWDDESFAEHQDLLNGHPFLESVKEIVEDEGEL